MKINEIHVSEPLSIVLIGDPSHKYGEYAVASPLNAYLYIEAYESDDTTIELPSDIKEDSLNEFDVEYLSRCIYMSIENVRFLLESPPLRMMIDPDLPLMGCLGSICSLGIGLSPSLIRLYSGKDPTTGQSINFANQFYRGIIWEVPHINLNSILSRSTIPFDGSSSKVIDRIDDPCIPRRTSY